MRTYASEMFAWYAGSVDADVYFCPERQATYFGSFYMKDRPAMGNAGYSISTSLTGDSGADFLNLLTDTQRGEDHRSCGPPAGGSERDRHDEDRQLRPSCGAPDRWYYR